MLRKSLKNIKKVQRELEQVSRDVLSQENVTKQKELAEELEQLLQMEEIHWAQRSSINWLMFGDRNTSYFQKFASAHILRNRISKLKDDQGICREGIAYLNPLISQYFAGLFSTEIDEPDPSLLEKVNQRVMTQMNEALLKPYTPKVVKKLFYSLAI